jgi:hypothetical protein
LNALDAKIKTMNTHVHKLRERIALVAVSAGLSSMIVLHKVESGSPHSALRIERLEVIDKDGKACVVIEGSHVGGTIQVLRPSRGDGPDGTIAFLGSIFDNDVRFYLNDPHPSGKTAVMLMVAGQVGPSGLSMAHPSIDATTSVGTPLFSLGGGRSSAPLLKLWDAQEEPYFEK